METRRPAEADTDVDWQAIPGPVLFAILALIGTAFVLLPIRPNEHFTDRFVRLSPFVCLHDIIERLVEIITAIYTRHRSNVNTRNDETPAIIIVRVTDTSHPRIAHGLRLLAFLTLPFLCTLRNATWTQVVADLYLSHAATSYMVPNHQAHPAERRYTTHQISSIIFAVLANWIICDAVSQADRIPTQYMAISNGGAGAAAYLLASVPGREHNFYAALGQLYSICCALCCGLFAFSQGLARVHLVDRDSNAVSEDETDYDRGLPFFPAMIACQCALLGHVISRGSLGRAHPGVRVVVGVLWVAMFAGYYCWVHEMYAYYKLSVVKMPSFWSLGMERWRQGL